MTLYVRRNQARLLLKVNKQPMYKHGWKQKVGWAPIRESIIAAVLNQTQILEQTGCVRLWDPFCGSGTIALVAAAQWHGVGVRGDTAANFTWPHWRVYKPEYL
jgi:23S rRNA G2445 N2-methylase RlmL